MCSERSTCDMTLKYLSPYAQPDSPSRVFPAQFQTDLLEDPDTAADLGNAGTNTLSCDAEPHYHSLTMVTRQRTSSPPLVVLVAAYAKSR